jgi:lactocepin
MNTGWKLINGKWYYLNPKSGKMAYSTTIDGYKLGSDGAWIK